MFRLSPSSLHKTTKSLPFLSTQSLRNYSSVSPGRNLKPVPVDWTRRQPVYPIAFYGPWAAHDYSGLPEWIDTAVIVGGQQDEPQVLLEPHPEWDNWHWYLNWLYAVSIYTVLIFIWIYCFNAENRQVHEFTSKDIWQWEYERGEKLRSLRQALMEEHGLRDVPLEKYPTKADRMQKNIDMPSF